MNKFGETHSCPVEVVVSRSGALCVVKRDLPCCSILGPYPSNGYPDPAEAYEQCKNVDTPSWMSIIKVSKSKTNINLVEFLHNGNLFYRTIKHINCGSELFLGRRDDSPRRGRSHRKLACWRASPSVGCFADFLTSCISVDTSAAGGDCSSHERLSRATTNSNISQSQHGEIDLAISSHSVHADRKPSGNKKLCAAISRKAAKQKSVHRKIAVESRNEQFGKICSNRPTGPKVDLENSCCQVEGEIINLNDSDKNRSLMRVCASASRTSSNVKAKSVEHKEFYRVRDTEKNNSLLQICSSPSKVSKENDTANSLMNNRKGKSLLEICSVESSASCGRPRAQQLSWRVPPSQELLNDYSDDEEVVNHNGDDQELLNDYSDEELLNDYGDEELLNDYSDDESLQNDKKLSVNGRDDVRFPESNGGDQELLNDYSDEELLNDYGDDETLPDGYSNDVKLPNNDEDDKRLPINNCNDQELFNDYDDDRELLNDFRDSEYDTENRKNDQEKETNCANLECKEGEGRTNIGEAQVSRSTKTTNLAQLRRSVNTGDTSESLDTEEKSFPSKKSTISNKHSISENRKRERNNYGKSTCKKINNVQKKSPTKPSSNKSSNLSKSERMLNSEKKNSNCTSGHASRDKVTDNSKVKNSLCDDTILSEDKQGESNSNDIQYCEVSDTKNRYVVELSMGDSTPAKQRKSARQKRKTVSYDEEDVVTVRTEDTSIVERFTSGGDESFSETTSQINDDQLNTYKCDNCDFRTDRPQKLKMHSRIHTEEALKCTLCDYCALRGEHMKEHMRIHTGKLLECDKCDFKTAWASSLKSHQHYHTGRLLKCSKCKYTTPHPRTLRVHMKKHTGDNMIQCSLCDYKAMQPNHMESHMRGHSGERLKCNLCDFKTVNQYGLKNHMRTHTGNLYQCDQCSYSTPWLGGFNTHMYTHSSTKLKCEDCDYETYVPKNLKNHRRKHSGDLLQCDLCDFSTLWPKTLKAHYCKHTGEGYKCEVCSYVTARPDNLKSHMRIHNKTNKSDVTTDRSSS